MIIKGKARAASGQMASYIEKPGENELVQVHEVRGAMATDPRGAIQEMAAIASASRCKSFLYHAQINPKADEHLTSEQWQKAVDTLEKNLGLEGHQRIVFEHVKEGRQHYHIVWNRVDVESLRAVHMSNSYAIHERTARDLERKFNLERVQGVHAEREPETRRPARTPQQWEIERGQKSGIDPRQIKAEVTELWNTTTTGKEFIAAIEERGYVLIKGDRRDFCFLDQAGDIHSLARRIDGVKAADIREKMKDVDRERLPSAANILYRQKQQTRDALKPPTEWQERSLTPPKAYARQQQEVTGLEPRDDSKGVRLMVSGLGGITEKLVSYVEGITDFFAPPRAITYDEFLKNAEDRKEYYRQKTQEEKREQALKNIRDDMKAGKHLSASDVRNLNQYDIEQIKHFGDDGIRQIIEQREREQLQRDRENEIGRQRKRER